jgi:hypothetical protein
MSGHWNHRVMRHVEPDGHVWFGIHEVFYDDTGRPEGWSEPAEAPAGETLEELAANLAQMTEALKQPVLEYEDAKKRTG